VQQSVIFGIITPGCCQPVQQNTVENRDRYDFYYDEIFSHFIPLLILDGVVAEGTSSNATPTASELGTLVSAALTGEPGFLIDISADFSSESFTPEVTLTAMQDGVDLSGHTLFVALVQSYFESEEAYQSVTDFHWLFRDRVDTPETLTALTVNQPQVFNPTLSRGADWDLDTLHVIAFVQNNATKEILQAGISGTAAHAPASLFINDDTQTRPTIGGNRQ